MRRDSPPLPLSLSPWLPCGRRGRAGGGLVADTQAGDGDEGRGLLGGGGGGAACTGGQLTRSDSRYLGRTPPSRGGVLEAEERGSRDGLTQNNPHVWPRCCCCCCSCCWWWWCWWWCTVLPPMDRSAETHASLPERRPGRTRLRRRSVSRTQEVGARLSSSSSSSSQMQKWRSSFLSINSNRRLLAAALLWTRRERHPGVTRMNTDVLLEGL